MIVMITVSADVWIPLMATIRIGQTTLIDYKCNHCGEMHIATVLATHPKKLAVSAWVH